MTAVSLSSFRRRAVTALLLAHLLALFALAASPRLHHWLHADADHDDHECSVTLFLSGGGCDAPALAVALPAALPLALGADILVSNHETWVASVFAFSRIFEHGPPAIG